MPVNFIPKRHQRLWLLPILLGLLLSSGNSLAQQTHAPDLMVVFDNSGSMGGRINGVFKLHIAADVVTRLASHLPESSRIGTIVYGQTMRRCDQVKTLLPLRAHSRDTLEKTLWQLNASGQSSLTAAVRAALLEIRNRNQPTTLLLVVDGVDSCGGDTCALVRSAVNRGLDFSTHIIGLRLDEGAESELRCIAEASNGDLHHIRNLTDLDFAMGQVLFAALSTTTPTLVMNGNATPRGSLRTPELITTTRSSLGTRSISPARIDAPDHLNTGQSFRVNWSGTSGQWDYVTLVHEDAPESDYGYYVYTREGNPLTFQAPAEAGQFELRYVDGMTQRTLARHPLTVR